jgi:hypothetical protein
MTRHENVKTQTARSGLSRNYRETTTDNKPSQNPFNLDFLALKANIHLAHALNPKNPPGGVLASSVQLIYLLRSAGITDQIQFSVRK